MTQCRHAKSRLAAAVFIATAIISGSALAMNGCDNTQPIEISLSETATAGQVTQVYICGAVNNPGYYNLETGDSIESLIQAAGGISGADLNRIELSVSQEEDAPQKIDINRAEAWLLEALPGIGEVKAQAIIDYREQNGLFKNTNELLNVEGIGQSTLDSIEGLITVAD